MQVQERAQCNKYFTVHWLNFSFPVAPGNWLVLLKGVLIMANVAANLCGSCGFGSKSSQCIKCAGPFAKIQAHLCGSCGFGSKATQCVKCGGAFAKTAAHLCSSCGFGSKANQCVKCGRSC